MKNVLLICQSQDGSYVNLLHAALKPLQCNLTVVTGKTLDIENGVTIVEAPKYNSASFKSRFKTWFSYVKFAKKFLKENIDRFDLVMFTSNPPINQSLVKYVQKKNKNCIYLVWDIYPDCIEKSFGKKAMPITSVWRKINRNMYHKCDAVLTIGDVMKGNILESYPKLDIQVIPYHTDTEFIRPINKNDNFFIDQNHLRGKKVFMYSGKMGFGHGFEDILETARNLKDRSDIAFVFIGHGSAYKDVEKYITDYALSNAMILPYQPLEALPYSLGAADVSFITIKEQTDGLFLPSKVYDAMASGSAIISISGGNNDVAAMVEKENIGIQVKGGSIDALKAAVLRLADDEVYLQQCQAKARELAVKEYRIEHVSEQYAQMFRKVLQKKD